MKNYIFLTSIILSISLNSCAVGKKKYLAEIEKRDSVMTVNTALQNDTTNLQASNRYLRAQIETLQSEKVKLESDLAELSNKSLSEQERLSLALKNKTEDLERKETLLILREQKLRELQDVISKQEQMTRDINNKVKNALLGFRSDELSVEMKNGSVYVSMSDNLLFKSGSASIESKGKEAFEKLAEVLNRETELQIMIEGHTDSIPIKTAVYKDNWDLSVARATSIVRILSDTYKVDPLRLTAAGRGEYFPKATNSTPEGRAANRRTEIIISPNLDELFKMINQ